MLWNDLKKGGFLPERITISRTYHNVMTWYPIELCWKVVVNSKSFFALFLISLRMTVLSGNSEFCFNSTLNVPRGEGEQVLAVKSSYLGPQVSMDCLRRIPKVIKEVNPYWMILKQKKTKIIMLIKKIRKTFTYFSTDALKVSPRHGIVTAKVLITDC